MYGVYISDVLRHFSVLVDELLLAFAGLGDQDA